MNYVLLYLKEDLWRIILMIEKKLTKHQQKTIETKRKILKSAKELINEYGFENVTIQEICENAQITTGAFYHNYKSKNDILVEVSADIEENLKEKMNLLTFSNQEQYILKLIEYQAKYVVEGGLKSSIAGQIAFLSQENYKEIDYLPQMLYEALERGVQTGEFFITGDCKEVTDDIVIIIRGAIQYWVFTRGSFDLTEKMMRFTKGFLNRIKNK